MAAKAEAKAAAARVEAAKSEAKIDRIRDRSTEHGSVSFRTTTVEQYLTDLGIYNPDDKTIDFASDRIAVTIQRSAMRIQSNHILERMVETLLRGGLLPTIALQEEKDGSLRVLDGLQRSNCMASALAYLMMSEDDHVGDLPEFAVSVVTKLKEQQKLLRFEELLKQPVSLQIWHDLTESESVRLFVVLNIAQQKVTLRHLLEALNHQLEELFTSWDITSYSEKAQRAAGGATRGRRPKPKPGEEPPPGPDGMFKLEFLINSVRAYVSRNPHVKTRSALEEAYKADSDALSEMGPNLLRNLMSLGDPSDSAAKDDFQWLFHDINDEINRVYANDPKWQNMIASSDNVVMPLLAALGKARESHPETVDEHKQYLLDQLQQADPDSDPLNLSDTSSDSGSLGSILARTRPNVAGKVCRNVVYAAVSEYFRIGATEDVIFDWVEASKR